MLISAINLSWTQGFVALAVMALACVLAIIFAALFAQKVSRWSLWKMAPSNLAVLVLLSCVTTDLAQKAGGDRGGENGELRIENENGELGGGTRGLPPALASASNLIAILNFVPDPPNKEVAFEVACSNILFDYTASRNLYLFASTNLLEPRWMPIGAFAMPADTNICAFAVTTNDVDAAVLPWFLDSMNGLGFFRFAADIDSDYDGLIDSYETLWTLTDPYNPDTDRDGLSDGYEIDIGTDPLVVDSDGDGMNDGWEYRHRDAGFDPTVDNATDLNPDNDADADPDGDGVTNAQECEWGTNPSGLDENHDGVPDGYDTDGDGVNDGAEIAQNSDPADAGDEGRPDSRAPVSFYFGDPSDSHSEKYRLEVTPVSGVGDTPSSFSRFNENYGQCETKKVMLKPGWSYAVRLHHAGSDPNYNDQPKPDYDYRLECRTASLPSNVVVEDPSSLFGTDYTSTKFGGKNKVATITVYAVTGVTVCKPEDPSWTELEASRVVLDDEELRVKIEVAPQLKSLAQCQQMFGDTLTVKTSGTRPAGTSVPIGNGTIVNSSGKSEIRIALTRQQLKSLGLLPSSNEDGVNEMTWYDVGDDNASSDSNLSDSRAFSGIGYQFRGRILDPSLGDLNSSPPVSINSESFYKSAGCEIITLDFGGASSARRQIMNQADYFYYSGHGLHSDASLMGLANGPRLAPSLVSSYWNRDLKCVVFAGCSVLDINDCNGNYSGTPEHTSSPGRQWANIEGPNSFLGYAYYAPRDTQGADRIASAWVANRSSMGDVDAWMKANDNRNGRNACAIERMDGSLIRYSYFRREKGFLYNSYFLTNVTERITQ